jgi:hypothetical protein
MVRDDAMHEGQPHAGPLSGPLGGEKGLKNAVHDFGCHTMACIGHGDAGIRPRLQLGLLRRHLLVYIHGLQTYLQASAHLTHGVCGIGAEIQEHLMELRWIGQDRADILGDSLMNLNGRGKRGPQ